VRLQAQLQHGVRRLKTEQAAADDDSGRGRGCGLPDGLEVRPVRSGDYRTIWDADVEAFRDHFEASVRTEADYVQWITSPTLDTSLWQVAWDGDEVAGSVITSINAEENEKLGLKIAWLDHISVRRPWRKRGVASALIASTLHILRERGMEVAALGVDAENPTGALRVYEAMGFARHKTGIRAAVRCRGGLPMITEERRVWRVPLWWASPW